MNKTQAFIHILRRQRLRHCHPNNKPSHHHTSPFVHPGTTAGNRLVDDVMLEFEHGTQDGDAVRAEMLNGMDAQL